MLSFRPNGSFLSRWVIDESSREERLSMTNEQKIKIAELRCQGHSYAKIAAQLSLSSNTVKSYCQRNALGVTPPKPIATCKRCGVPISIKKNCKVRQFCSDKCRVLRWKEQHQQIYPKSIYHLICGHCGRDFDSAGNRSRKYCSHECYIAARFGKERGADE